MRGRLRVLAPEELHARIVRAARRHGISRAEWIRQAIQKALRPGARARPEVEDPVAQLASLNAPTRDIEQMLREIEAGRSFGSGRRGR